ncbi:MAG TPA: hypothetical protein VFJ16_17560 [Longimicrobium sp.]|nr:hypothetical protein [Longimicrobium sp.]
MQRYDWARLNPLQVGRYAEYFAKMEFTLYGFEVYTSEVDDRCVDFVVRREGGQFFDVQVKSLRGYGYIFIEKRKLPISPHRLVATVVLHPEREPELYLLPMTAWLVPSQLLVSRDYAGLKSKPEWGINISRKNQPLLDTFRFNGVIGKL